MRRFNAYSKRVSFSKHVKDDNLAVGGRLISVWRSQKFGFPIYFTADILSLIRDEIWYDNKMRSSYRIWVV